MADSKVKQIKERLIVEIEASTTVESATDGFCQKKGSRIWAEIFIGDMEFTATDLSNYIDGNATLTINVFAKNGETVQYALEELLGLFLPLSAALTALDVGVIVPLTTTEPTIQDDASLEDYMGEITYRIDIRYTY